MTSSEARARDRLLAILNSLIEDTRVSFVTDEGEHFVGPPNYPVEVSLQIKRPAFFHKVLVYSNLGLGEAYMDGDFEVVGGRLDTFLTLLLRNRLDQKMKISMRLAVRALGLMVRNKFRGTIGNVRARYDVGNALCESFLDSTLTYGGGYALSEDDSLDQLQHNKMERICQKLQIRDGDTVVDLGCGYGSVLMFAAEQHGATGQGITINAAQIERGMAEVARRGLNGRVDLTLGDYKAMRGQYGKLICVEMLEHLPRGEYREFYETMRRLLKPGGFGLLQVSCRSSASNLQDPFTMAHTAPGVRQPRLSEVAQGLEKAGLQIVDVENIIRHYHRTVRGWLKKFHENRERLEAVYGQRFVRMWEYHLSGGVAGTSGADFSTHQILFTNDRAAKLPLRRV